MQTFFDWTTMALFGGLVVLFLQRSASPEDAPRDSIYHYIPPALGCAFANYLGNNGQPLFAIAVVVAIIGYALFVLSPFGKR